MIERTGSYPNQRGDVKHRRPVAGILAGLFVLVLVALPAAWFTYAALVSFSGCFIECSQPEPAVGLMWASLAGLLLMLPVATGLIVTRVPLKRAWPWLAGGGGLFLVGFILLQQVA